MAKFEIVMPKLGESIIEATITKWMKKEGDAVKEDEPILEIATDKVDSEIPSPVEGILVQRFFQEGDVVPVGTVIALIDMGGEDASPKQSSGGNSEPSGKERTAPKNEKAPEPVPAELVPGKIVSNRFYSPLIKNIAKQENIPLQELENVPGTGTEGRLTKQDLLNFISTRGKASKPQAQQAKTPSFPVSAEDQVIAMDRMRQLISSHMLRSVQTSPHVTSIVETDMTRIVNWRDKHKDPFFERENIKLTFTPIFIEAIAGAVRDFPQVNVSVDETNIILHKNINIGMAVALPNFNLIVPVIKNADQKSLLGIIRDVTDLAERARSSRLKPDEIMGGTISLTNLGSFGTLTGTPIINQPQTAIVAVGSIRKRPVVIDTLSGDAIVVRQMMFLSLTFDHRVIDGALAGQFLNKMSFYLENFDTNQNI